MANIVLKTFAAGDEGQGTVTPQDDSLIYQNAVSVNGIFGGATVTLTGANTLHVASGFGIICGRFFEINESDISVQLSSSGTLSGRLKIHLDLNNADNPIEIVTETGSTLPALSGDSNINVNGGAFDMELCTFSVNELTISSLVNTFPTIDNTSKQIRRKTAYAVNDFVLCQSASDALIFICTTAGTTAIQEPKAYQTVADGNTVTDGTAVFKAVSVSGQITKLSKTEDLISNSGDAYDGSKAYAVGDLVIYNNKLYRCTTACSAGSWVTNQSCFTADTLVNVADKISTDLTSKQIFINSITTYNYWNRIGQFIPTKSGLVKVSLNFENDRPLELRLGITTSQVNAPYRTSQGDAELIRLELIAPVTAGVEVYLFGLFQSGSGTSTVTVTQLISFD